MEKNSTVNAERGFIPITIKELQLPLSAMIGISARDWRRLRKKGGNKLRRH